jgi:hypothetical protein
MATWQELPLNLHEQLSVSGGDDHLDIALDGQSVRFKVQRVVSLTREDVARHLRAVEHDDDPLLIVYSRSSPDARRAMREARISYAGEDGRAFLFAPPLYVELDDRPRRVKSTGLETVAPSSTTRNPFAGKASRVPRWLLLHPDDTFSVTALARSIDLSPAAVSRVVRALDDAALAVTELGDDGRTRGVRLARGKPLLEAWAAAWERRHVKHVVWQVGARDADDAVRLLAHAASARPNLEWAIGGLAGVATTRRVVEPAEVLVWVRQEHVAQLRDELIAEPGRPGHGTLRVAIPPDPWVLGLARKQDDVRIADPVQLWLDCSREGERALEAADAIRASMRW